MSYIDSHIARIFLKNNLMVHLQRCILYLTATQLTRNFIFASQIMIMKQNVPCEYKESTLTFVSNSTSSVVAFFFISLVCISWWWKWKAARHCTKSRYVRCMFLVKWRIFELVSSSTVPEREPEPTSNYALVHAPCHRIHFQLQYSSISFLLTDYKHKLW